MAGVICLGCAVLDRVFAVESLPAGPGKLRATAFEERGGGMAATAAVAVSALGGRAALWARVGRDSAGSAVLAELSRAGVDVAHVLQAPGGQTATSAVHVDAAGERALTNFAGRDLPAAPDWLPFERLRDAGCVLADIRWADGARALFERARTLGLPRVLDADAGDPEAVRRLLPLTSHAVFSDQGLRAVSRLDDPATGLRAVADRADGVVGVTLSGNGSLWLTDGALFHVPAFAVEARNTNGAGDVFHGAYALALAEGADHGSAVRFATAAAALKVQDRRGWDGMPSRERVRALLAGG